LSNELAKLDVPVKLLIDSAVAYTMDEIDMVFVGADGVVESGGIINMMGTFQIALVAHSMNKPVYVAAESYKVCQSVPLGLYRSIITQLISLVINQLQPVHSLKLYFIINRNLNRNLPTGLFFFNLMIVTY
jgi:translation initiation factor 2B subunit (eIF-2B alpha/beta/delta family)